MNAKRRSRAPRFSIEVLESRISPATLNLSGGVATFTAGNGVANTASLSIAGANYSITTTGETITLNAAAIAAGFIGSGTATVTGPNTAVSSFLFSLGDQADILTINGLTDAITVQDGAGTDTVALGGAIAPGAVVDFAAESINVAFAITSSTSVNLTGNAVNIGATITASTQVTVQPLTAGREMSIGAESGSQTSLTDIEFDRISAPLFNVGSATAGNINVVGGVTPVADPAIFFRSGGRIADSATGFLNNNLVAADAVTGVSFTNLANFFTNFEAETESGGITVAHAAPLTIGGVSASTRGLFVQTSGDIDITTVGTLTLADTDGIETVHGGGTSGDIRLKAVGVTSNIVATVDQDTLFARGSIYLDAGQDILLGTGGADFDNDARAGQDIVIHAGRDFVIDGFADMAANDQALNTGGKVFISTGRNIAVSDTTGTDASVGVSGSGGGQLTLQTAPGGQILLSANSTSAAFAGTAGILIRTDRLIINADSGITASGGGVVTIEPASSGREINLGSATDVGAALEISQSELNRVFSSVLRIGNATTAGIINLTNAVTRSGTLALLTAASIIDNVAGESTILTVPNLRLHAGGGMGDGNDIDLAVTNLAFTGTGTVNLESSSALTIATADGISTSTAGGNLFLSAVGVLHLAAPITSTAGTITLSAGSITQQAPLTQQAGGGSVLLIASGSDIVVAHPNNDFSGVVTTTTLSPGLVKLSDLNDLILGTQGINGLLEISAGGSVSQTGVIFGAGSLRYTGSGAMVLDQANTYLGNTEVSGGILVLSGSVASPTIIARDGGTLVSAGILGNAIEIRGSGRLDPGPGVGIATVVTGIQFSPGASFKVDLNGTTPGVTHDQLAVTGSLKLTGVALLGSVGFSPTVGDEFVIIANDGTDAVVGTFAGVPEGGATLLGGQLFRVSYKGGDGNDVVLTAGAVAGKSFTFADADGDIVTVKTTVGSFTPANFVVLETPTGPQIAKITLGADFKGANLTISAKATKTGGNGLVNIGHIDATGVDLGVVTVKGDLGQIDAGDGDPAAPALKGLIVQSLGNLGLSTQGPGGSLSSDLAGLVSSLTVKGDIRDAIFRVTGADSKLLKVSLGGSLIGGQLRSDGGFGNLKILGSVIGGTISADAGGIGTIAINGAITDGASLLSMAGAIKSLTVGGHLGSGVEIRAGTSIGAITVKNEIAGSSTEPVIISAFGLATAPAKGVDTAIKSLTVRGRVEFLQLLAGYSPSGVGANADGSIGAIKVGGDWVASTVLAGVSAGVDGFVGTDDDAKLSGPGVVRDESNLVATIGSISIRGQAIGTLTAGDAFGVVAELIGKAQVGGVSLPLVKGASSPTDIFPLAPTGPGGSGQASDFFAREV